jgi:signal transduction histidine kinase/CheY-like chemotaxis protein/PAS domain-containing protein
MDAIELKPKKESLLSKRFITTGIAAILALLAITALLIINISGRETLDLEIAILVGESKLKGDMIHFKSMLKTEYGELRLQNGELVDNNGYSLAHHNHLVDHLAKDLGIVASVFVKENDDYRRIATSVTDSKGNRAVDTFLGSGSAAYGPIQAGKEYIGRAVILGKDYLTMHSPIFQPDTNEVIGALAVSVEMAEIHNIIAQKSTMRAAQTFIIRTVLIALGTLFSVVLITLFMRISAERNDADERMRIMFNTMPLGANFHDKNFDFFICNESVVKLFGFSSKKEYIDNFYRLSPAYQPDGSPSKEKIAENTNKAFNDGYFRFEWMHQKLNGEPIPCEITLVRVKHGNEFALAAYVRDLRELKQIMKEVEQRERLLNTVNSVAGVLLSINDLESFESSLLRSFELVGNCLDVDRVQIWCNEAIDSELHFVHRYRWLSECGRNNVHIPIGLHFPYSSIPEWENLFMRGEYINSPLSELNENERSFLNSYGMKSIVIIPMFLEGNFWGFFSIDDCRRERAFSDEEIQILASVGLMMSSAVNRSIQSVKMREADERMRIMFNTMPLGAIIRNENFDYFDCNESIVNMFELSGKQEFSDKFDQLSPEYQPDGSLTGEKIDEFVGKALADGYCRFEWMHQKLNGEPIPCEVTLIRVKYNNEINLTAYVRDLRELKVAITQKNESEQSRSLLNNILNSINAQVYVIVPHSGEILFVNNFMKNEFKVGDDCIGKLCYKIFLKDVDGICDFCPCYQLDKEPDSTVVWEMRNPITNRTYRNTTRYIEWSDGRTVQIQHSFDLTELIEAKELAERNSRSKNQFLSRMSHEIRTPMNAILGITEIQLQDETTPPGIREFMDKIYNSGYLLLGIINDILDLSKIEAGKLELSPSVYDVPSLINDTVHLNIVRYDSKPVEFHLHVDENIPSKLYGDELRIKQILNNLLSNAFKYTDEGEISLSVAAEFAPQVTRQVTLMFQVSDTGQGMTGEQVDKLFDEYTRFNTEANRTTEGTGLGMNITKHLVCMMDGDISVESEPGKGSVFTVRLPQGIVSAEALGIDAAESLKQFRISKAEHINKAPQIIREYMPYGRVLIVDDVETNLYVAKGLMAPYGLSIDTAVSGFEAIEKIKSGSNFDIIFMDHFMPKMDGIEAVKIIRDLGYTHPIIALTANALTGQAEMFMENGFDGFISKPVDIRQLNTTLNKLVRDKYPPDVVEKARQLAIKINMEKSAVKEEQQASGQELAAIFVRDAEKALARLESIHAYEYRRTDDIRSYVINIHAMKSALASIGETDLSTVALKLEQAGRAEDIPVLKSVTPAFLEALSEVIKKNRPKENKNNVIIDDSENLAYLAEKLAAIRTACEKYDEVTAYAALAELKNKEWSGSTKDLLDTISMHLLHSDFEKAAKLAENKN